jgi:hypothetical protein
MSIDERTHLLLLAARLCVDQVIEGFCLQQIHPPVQVGPPRKLPRSRHSQSSDLAQGSKDRLDNGDAAVQVVLHQVLPRKSIWSLKVEHKSLVQQGPALWIDQAANTSIPRLGGLGTWFGQGSEGREGIDTRHSHDCDPAHALRRGLCVNGPLVLWRHLVLILLILCLSPCLSLSFSLSLFSLSASSKLAPLPER